MLAYVFWHWPAAGVDPAQYREALTAFHRALGAAPPPGMRGSRVFAVEAAPWIAARNGFEDWYFVDDFTALGALNEAAVSGPRREPHDAAARLVAGGAGGVYRQVSPGSGAVDRATWLHKPAGVSQDGFLARLPPAEIWQRQMVLGPAPEFCLLGAAAPAGLAARTLQVRLIHPA